MNILLIIFAFVLVSCSGIQTRYHQVTTGETLSGIASKYEVPVRELKDVNAGQLGRKGLRAGTKLYIPFEKRSDWDTEFVAESSEPRVVASSAEYSVVRFSWPVMGFISSAFGKRRNDTHDGIDIVARQGTQVKASRSGHVIYAGNGISGYGNLVILSHPGKFSTVYAHLSKIDVKKGQFVSRSQRVGRVGKTGRATNPHLHFEIRSNRVPVNPLLYLQGQYAKNTLGR